MERLEHRQHKCFQSVLEVIHILYQCTTDIPYIRINLCFISSRVATHGCYVMRGCYEGLLWMVAMRGCYEGLL